MKTTKTKKQNRDRQGTSLLAENKKLQLRIKKMETRNNVLENELGVKQVQMNQMYADERKSANEFEKLAYHRIGQLESLVKEQKSIIDYFHFWEKRKTLDF